MHACVTEFDVFVLKKACEFVSLIKKGRPMGMVIIKHPAEGHTISLGEVFEIDGEAHPDSYPTNPHAETYAVSDVRVNINGGTLLQFSVMSADSNKIRDFKGRGVADGPGQIHVTVTAIPRPVPNRNPQPVSSTVDINCVGDNLQTNWRYCGKCEGLWFAGNSTSICPAGDAHSTDPSFNYALRHDVPGGQEDWRYCIKCQGLWFAGNTATAPCPAGGGHTKRISDNYVLKADPVAPGEQDSWLWCGKCQGLWYGRGGRKGACPGWISNQGEEHDGTGSLNYSLKYFSN